MSKPSKICWMMTSTATIRLVNTLSFIFMIVINTLANALPLNGYTTGELSAKYPNLFVPAGFTFSIWGIIYLLILSFMVWQFLPKNEHDVLKIGPWFALSSLLNGLWIVTWHYLLIELSLIVMFALLASLIWINGRLISGMGNLVRITFGVYLGWISIATIANFTALLVYWNFSGWAISAATWSILLIGIGLLVTLILLRNFSNVTISWSVIWAFFGIYSKQLNQYPEIAYAAMIGIVVLGLIQIFALFKPNLVFKPTYQNSSNL